MKAGSHSVIDPYQMFGATSSRLASSGKLFIFIRLALFQKQNPRTVNGKLRLYHVDIKKGGFTLCWEKSRSIRALSGKKEEKNLSLGIVWSPTRR